MERFANGIGMIAFCKGNSVLQKEFLVVQVYNQKFFKAGGQMLEELGHFSKHFVKNAKNGGPSGKHLGVFSPIYSQNYIFNGKFNPKMDTIRATFSKIKTLFSIFKNGRGGLPSSS